MPDGGCYCGKCRFSYTGEVQGKALCHCTDCRKISGSAYSTNFIVPGEGFSVTSGTPKEYTTKADSGNPITSYFCGDCGSTMFRGGPTFGTSYVVKVGCIDAADILEQAKPGVELYVPERASWAAAVGGAAQKKSMPDSEDI